MFSASYDGQFIFEQKQEIEKQAQHALHYVWDAKNPYQRRWVPLQTMLSFEAGIHKIRAIRSVLKDSDLNFLKRLDQIPVLVIIGSEDPIIPNADAQAVFDHIPGTNKQIIIEQGMGHGVFSHGVIKHKVVEYLNEHYTK